MQRIILIFLASLFLLPEIMVQAKNNPGYYIPYFGNYIMVDGDLRDWKIYQSIGFSDTLKELRPAPGRILSSFDHHGVDYSKTWEPLSKNEVEVWMCWNLSNLYFAFQVKDEHLFTEISPGEDHFSIYLNDGIEVYIDSKCDSQLKMDFNDYQFIVDVTGNYMVFRGDKHKFKIETVAVPKLTDHYFYFEAAAMITRRRDGHETGYTIELAIPFASLGIKPETGLQMKIDLCNNDIDYTLLGAKTFADSALRYWPFNMNGYSDFGYPETWQTVQLAGNPGWIATLSATTINRYFIVYTLVLAISILAIILLVLRMMRLQRLPIRSEMSTGSILFLNKLDTNDAAVNTNQEILQKAVDYVNLCSQETINSERLAHHLRISIRKLQRITHKELNCTPTSFIYIVKLNLAAEFLKQGKANVSQTAYEFGFSDPGYFTRLFHKHFGISPMEYLASHKSKKK